MIAMEMPKGTVVEIGGLTAKLPAGVMAVTLTPTMLRFTFPDGREEVGGVLKLASFRRPRRAN